MQALTTLAQVVALVAQSPHPLYVRWSSDIAGDLRRGYSLNHQTGQREAGLSVNPLQSDLFAGAAYIAQQLAEYQYLALGTGARPYILAGAAAGQGADNEPVIAEAELVGAVTESVIAEAVAVNADVLRARILDAATRYPWLTGRDLHRQVARVVGCWPEDVAKILEA